MKIKYYPTLILILLSSILYAQNEETETFSTDINFSFQVNEDVPDSIFQKMQIITQDLGIPILIAEFNIKNIDLEKPEKVKEKDFDQKIGKIIQEIYDQFYQENPEIFTKVIQHYITNYSLEELEELTAFYQTDLGKKERNSLLNLFLQLDDSKSKIASIKQEVYLEIFGKKGKL